MDPTRSAMFFFYGIQYTNISIGLKCIYMLLGIYKRKKKLYMIKLKLFYLQ